MLFYSWIYWTPQDAQRSSAPEQYCPDFEAVSAFLYPPKIVVSQNPKSQVVVIASFSLILLVRSSAPISCNKPTSQVKHFSFLLPGRHLALAYLWLYLGLKPKSSKLHFYLFFFLSLFGGGIFLDFENGFIFFILSFAFYFPLEHVYTLSVIFLFLSFCI